MRKSISFIVIVTFLLSACADQAGVVSLITDTPTLTPSSTLRSSRTPKPSSTPRLTRTITNTPEPSPTIPPATVIAQATLDNLALDFPDLAGNYWTGSISPSRKWASLNNSIVVRLVEINGDGRWDITYNDYHSIYICRPDCIEHAGYLGIDHWSNDNAHIYLILFPFWDGPGLWFTTGGSTLIRFNLIDGSWADMNIGATWSFSADERYLVYPDDDGIHLRMMLYDSEYVIPIPEKFETLGKFVWSPNNEKFVFTATHGEWANEEIGFSSFVFDTTDLSLRLLFEDDIRYLYPVEWSEKDRIIFCQYDMGWLHVSIPDPGCFYFDLNTNEITRIPGR